MRTSEVIGIRLESGEEIFLGIPTWPSSPFTPHDDDYVSRLETIVVECDGLVVEVVMSSGLSLMLPAAAVIFAEQPGLEWFGDSGDGCPDGLSWQLRDGERIFIARQHLGRYFRSFEQPGVQEKDDET